jgi:hypothetical protein
VQLSQVGQPSRTLSGAVKLDKVSPDKLRLQAGSWRNEAGQLLSYKAADNLNRQGNQYSDSFIFEDGDPATAEQDYLFWTIRIVDPNDNDSDGIPDISDGPVARRPVLAITLASTNVLLSISGELGKQHEIQQSLTLLPASWLVITNVTLTNDPQTISLRRITNPAAFFRARVP